MVNPIGHWLRILFGTRLPIYLRGLSGFRGIGIRSPLRGLFRLRVTPVLAVPEYPLLVPVCRSFEFSMSFFCCFLISWYHFSMVPYWVVFCDITRQAFIFLFPEYMEIFFSDSISDPIKSHVYCSGSFFCRSVDDSVCFCIARCHQCWWF